ncbi:MAG: hypothetical protein AAB580_01270, partial [Patescibacteria group bacterium]
MGDGKKDINYANKDEVKAAVGFDLKQSGFSRHEFGGNNLNQAADMFLGALLLGIIKVTDKKVALRGNSCVMSGHAFLVFVINDNIEASFSPDSQGRVSNLNIVGVPEKFRKTKDFQALINDPQAALIKGLNKNWELGGSNEIQTVEVRIEAGKISIVMLTEKGLQAEKMKDQRGAADEKARAGTERLRKEDEAREAAKYNGPDADMLGRKLEWVDEEKTEKRRLKMPVSRKNQDSYSYVFENFEAFKTAIIAATEADRQDNPQKERHVLVQINYGSSKDTVWIEQGILTELEKDPEMSLDDLLMVIVKAQIKPEAEKSEIETAWRDLTGPFNEMNWPCMRSEAAAAKILAEREVEKSEEKPEETLTFEAVEGEENRYRLSKAVQVGDYASFGEFQEAVRQANQSLEN